MRVSWYADTGVAVFSIWQGDTCTGTFRLPIPELPRMVEALTQGPAGRAGSGSRTGGPGLRQADPGPATAAMGPGGMPVPVHGQPADEYPPPYREHEQTPRDRRRSDPPTVAGYPGSAPGGPTRDLPPQHGYGAPHDVYAEAAPAGYPEGPQTAKYPGAGPDGYQEGPYTGTAPGVYQEGAPAPRYPDAGPGNYQGPVPGGQHQVPAEGYYPEGRHDLPPEGYYQGLPPGGYHDLPPGGYHDLPPGGHQDLPPGGHQDLPPGGYRDLPPGGRYPDVPPGAGYHAPDDGYRRPAAAAPAEGGARFAGRQQDPYPPTGPLPVGRWRTDAPSDEFLQARPEHGDRFAPHAPPADTFAADEFAPDEYPGDGFAQDEFADDGFQHDPLADSYQGEAEQGYLPSPPTDMFPAASLSAGYRGQGSHRAGYEPEPADLDNEHPYPAERGDRGGPPRDSGAYRPDPNGGREREYGHSSGRS